MNNQKGTGTCADLVANRLTLGDDGNWYSSKSWQQKNWGKGKIDHETENRIVVLFKDATRVHLFSGPKSGKTIYRMKKEQFHLYIEMKEQMRTVNACVCMQPLCTCPGLDDFGNKVI